MQGRYAAAIEDLSAAITIEGESRISGYLYHNRAIAYIGRMTLNPPGMIASCFIRFLRKNNLPVTVEDNYLLGALQYAVDDEDGALTSWKHMPSEEEQRSGVSLEILI